MFGPAGGGSGGTSMDILRSARRDKSVLARKVDRATWARIGRYANRYRSELIGLVLLTALGAAAGVVGPLLLQRIIDDGVTPKRRDVVLWLAALAALVALLEVLTTMGQRWFSATVGEGLIRDLRRDVFHHVQRQSLSFFTHTETGALVNRMQQDVVGAQRAFTTTLSQVVGSAMTLAGTLAAMVYLSWQVTAVALLIAPLFLLPSQFFGKSLQQITRRMFVANGELSTRLTERFNVGGALLVKLYGRSTREDQQFTDLATEVADLGRRSAMINRGFFATMTFMAALATAIVYAVGGVLTIGETMTVGTLLALVALVTRLYGPISALANVRVDVMTALVSFDRVFEILDMKPDVPEPVSPSQLPNEPLTLTFDTVSFHYPAQPRAASSPADTPEEVNPEVPADVLQQVSFELKPGQVLALVGPSGAGKSTIAALARRLYDPTSGRVALNGLDLRDVAGDELSRRIGMVPQDAHMFHDTIRANLLYANPGATDDQMLRALQQAHLNSLVETLPDGLETIVGERGHRLSGGEKQRLAIARLLLHNPEIVILDEATAHLDAQSEQAVHAALNEAMKDRTSLVIAHRLSTVRNADCIAALVDGRIVEIGTHATLLASGGVYADLYATQFATGTHADGHH